MISVCRVQAIGLDLSAKRIEDESRSLKKEKAAETAALRMIVWWPVLIPGIWNISATVYSDSIICVSRCMSSQNRRFRFINVHLTRFPGCCFQLPSTYWFLPVTFPPCGDHYHKRISLRIHHNKEHSCI
jgi:hypothetical protein